MGIPDGAHTHGHGGGGGPGTALLVLVAAALAVKLAGPVLAAAAELIHVLLIAAVIIVVVGAAGLAGVLTWRWRHPRHTARAMTPCSHKVVRAAPPPGEPRPAIERAPDIHLHLHGVTAQDIAAILARDAARPAPGKDPPGRDTT